MKNAIVHRLSNLLPDFVLNIYRKIRNHYIMAIRDFPRIHASDTEFNSDFGKHLQMHGGRPGAKWLHYVDIYDNLLGEFKLRSNYGEFSDSSPLKLLEIGVHHGGSLEVWSTYFKNTIQTFGIDTNPNCGEILIPGVQIRIGSQDDARFLSRIISELGNPHIIIDDGSHHVDHVESTLRILWPYLQDDGVYVIEDTYTSYWRSHGGGYKKRKTIIELIKESIDILHQPYTKQRMPIRAQFLSGSLGSVTIHNSLIILRKSKKDFSIKQIKFGLLD